MLTLGGHPLLIPDEELNEWLRQYLDVADSAIFFPPPAMQSDRNALRTRPEAEKGIGVPVMNYPVRPQFRLNSLSWPTGAGRWGFGLFLADEETKRKIIREVESKRSASEGQTGGAFIELRFGSDEPGAPSPVAASVYLLDPMPISARGFAETRRPENLFLIPVVDGRYWWQYTPVNLEVAQGDTWQDVVLAIDPSIDFGVIDGRFFNPSPIDLTRRWDNKAVLLDSVAWSIGKRVVYTLDGQTRLQSPDEADDAHSDNFVTENLGQRQVSRIRLDPIAGGEFSSEYMAVPEFVRIVFRKSIDGVVVPDADVWDVAKTVPQLTPIDGSSLTIHSSMLADMTSGGSTPDNECALECLAEAMRDAVDGWTASKYDVTLVGPVPWNISGFDNTVTWEMDGRFQTRVQSYPPNFFAEQQLSEDPESAQNADGTTSSTTTTPDASACGGRCKWTWNEAGQYWAKTTDGCGIATTTTSTSTTADPGTTTTTGDCDCSALETTTTSTSTTPEPECSCIYPVFCGVTDGDCTYTHCATEFIREAVSCTTTTTADPGTTTTTPDCSTSTTEDPGLCDTGCDWVYTPEGWRLTNNGCSEICPCPSPNGDGDLCSEIHTDCQPTPEPGATVCDGACTWFGVPSLGEWYKIDDTCPDISDCDCVIPSSPPDQCAPLDMPCGSRTTTTADPYASCYTTTSTSTTQGVCDGQCIYGWNTAGFWELTEADCGLGVCSCIEPAITGSEDCEVARTPCQGAPTTTTSTSTTPACNLGRCGWFCMDHGDGTGRWDLYANCVTAAGCGCKDGMTYSDAFTPEVTFALCEPCSPIGAVFNIYCTDDAPTYTNYDPPHLEGCSVTATSTTEAPNGACCWDGNTQCSDVSEADCAANYADGVWHVGEDCFSYSC